MKRIVDYINENIINIFEGATGIALSDTSGKISENTINKLIKYLEETFKEEKCIIPDNNSVIDKFSKLKSWFITENEPGKQIFYLKSSNHNYLCINAYYEFSDDELEKYHLNKINDSSFYIDETYGLKGKITITHKKEGKLNMKIWPDSWEIITGEYCNIDFKNKGAYKLDVSKGSTKIKNDLSKLFNLNNELPESIKQLFNSNDLDEEIKKHSNSYEFNKYLANVLSEPIAVISILDNKEIQNNLIEAIASDVELGKITEIIIPISQNWPDADFYVKFKNIDDLLIPISVKSGNTGHRGTFMDCIKLDEKYNEDNINRKDISDDVIELFKTIVPSLKDRYLKINNIKNLNTIAEYTLDNLEYFCKQTAKNNGERLISTFNKLVELTKESKKLYDGLKLISNNANIIDKFLCALFSASDVTLNRIKNTISNVKCAHKILVNNKGVHFKQINKKDDSLSNIKLSPLDGGKIDITKINLNADNNYIIDSINTHERSKPQGQYLGFSF